MCVWSCVCDDTCVIMRVIMCVWLASDLMCVWSCVCGHVCVIMYVIMCVWHVCNHVCVVKSLWHKTIGVLHDYVNLSPPPKKIANIARRSAHLVIAHKLSHDYSRTLPWKNVNIARQSAHLDLVIAHELFYDQGVVYAMVSWFVGDLVIRIRRGGFSLFLRFQELYESTIMIILMSRQSHSSSHFEGSKKRRSGDFVILHLLRIKTNDLSWWCKWFHSAILKKTAVQTCWFFNSLLSNPLPLRVHSGDHL